jgi:ribosomal protein S18 acetylase RimI-like enzyme
MEHDLDEDLEQELVSGPQVRRLRPSDMNAVVRLDAKLTGRRREKYFDTKLKMALADTGVEVSLAAELDDIFVGFLLARVYYGEFGVAEPLAVLDTFDVHPDFTGRGVAKALMRQLRSQLAALQISTLRTEVGWGSNALMGFFQSEGFEIAQRVCLDLNIETHQ